MRVLMQNRINAFGVPGGDTVQMEMTKKNLKRLGVEVDVSLDLEPDVSTYDVVHLFNLWRVQESYLQMRNARAARKPIVLSTIYWDSSEFERRGAGRLRSWLQGVVGGDGFERAKGIWRLVVDGEWNQATGALIAHGRRRLQMELLSGVDMLLPNANSEFQAIKHDFPKVGLPDYRVIPNAFDDELFLGRLPLEMVPEKYRHFEGCILCVARIEPRKNQLNLVRAAKGLGRKVVLVGSPAPNHRGYSAAVKRAGDGMVEVVGHVPHQELPFVYSVADVHVLPSWFETPGLSSIEAAQMGCEIVVTDRGTTPEYFGDRAWYCRPDSVESLRTAIQRALASSTRPSNRHQFGTWRETAEATLSAYNAVLMRTGQPRPETRRAL